MKAKRKENTIDVCTESGLRESRGPDVSKAEEERDAKIQIEEISIVYI